MRGLSIGRRASAAQGSGINKMDARHGARETLQGRTCVTIPDIEFVPAPLPCGGCLEQKKIF